MTLDLSTEWTAVPPRRAPRSCTRSRCATRSTRSPSASTPRSTTASTGAASPARRRPTTRPTTGCSPRWTGSPSGWPISAIWSATPSPRPTSGCSPRWPASTPSTTATSSATGSKLAEMPVLWAYARDLFQTPGFGDTIDFVQIKQHYYIVHTDINPTQIVPKGPDLSNWLTPHGREALGGRPFGDGTPPGPTRGGRARARRALGGLGPDGPHRPLGVRHRELVARLVADQRRQLHREAEQPASVRIHGGDGDRELACPAGTRRRRRRLRRTAPRPMARGRSPAAPTAAPGCARSTVSSPSVRGVSQSVGLSTSQYRYGPTRTSWPCE